MGATVELTNVHHIVLVLEHRSLHATQYDPLLILQLTYLIVVHVEIVGGRENCYQRGEPSGLAFSVHSVSTNILIIG